MKNFLWLSLVAFQATAASAAIDPTIVPLQDAEVMYFSNPSSTSPLAGMYPIPVISTTGVVEHQLLPNALSQNIASGGGNLRWALALASDQQQFIPFPNRVQNLNPQYNRSNPTAQWTSWILSDLAKADLGTFLMPNALTHRGTLTQAFNSNPSPASTIFVITPSSRGKVCWQQPVTLYSAYGNGLTSQVNGINPLEGPPPNPDKNTFSLPEAFCDPLP